MSTTRRLNSIGSVSTHTVATSPSRITASVGTAGLADAIVDADLEHREHLGLEQAIGILDLGPDDDTARRQV